MCEDSALRIIGETPLPRLRQRTRHEEEMLEWKALDESQIPQDLLPVDSEEDIVIGDSTANT